jgi:chloramphenicol O-acetyltransferase type B
MKRLVIRSVVRLMQLVATFYEVHRFDEARTPERFRMGEHSYAKMRVIAHPWDTGRISIGAFCSIAWDATFMVGGNHCGDCVSTFPFRIKFQLPNADRDGAAASKGDITVGNDVWIGSGALILSGVTIGDGAIIGANAVVGSDVRPYAVVVGNPAREIRRRFNDAQVAALEEIAWWDWPIEEILAHVDMLGARRIDEFIARYQKAA